MNYEVEFKAVKNLRLTVYPPDGRVRVTAPQGTGREIIKKFVLSKIGWIETQRQSFQNQPVKARPGIDESLKNGSTVFVWGKAHELEIIERNGNSKILLESGCMKFYVRPDSTKTKKQEYLDKWRRKILKGNAIAVIEKWENRTGISVKKLFIRKMKSCWGSCNYRKQTLRLNSELTKRNPECLDYVVLHEMLHIIEKGHNRNFYYQMSRYLPEWKSIRKKMKSGEL